jgi:peroxiredoxin
MTPLPRAARWLAIASTSLCLVAACGATTRGSVTPSAAAPVELVLTTAEGQRLDLHDLRGQPLLLFIFTTYDEVSQLALVPLERVLHARHDLRALGIAAQPQPQQLLPLYRDALGVSFPLSSEPENRVVAGATMLGPIRIVPSYLMLDAQGRIVARHAGPMTESQLEQFITAALH